MITQAEKNLQAQQQAILALNETWINPARTISYKSKGFVLIIGESSKQAQRITDVLNTQFNVKYLLKTKLSGDDTLDITYGDIIDVKGYLGSFEVSALVDNKPKALLANVKECFDIIINLTNKPRLAPVLPFGYYAISQPNNNTDTYAEINQLIGILDKPKFFNLDTSICVHSRNKTDLCQRCIDTCPAQAISSNGDDVDVNPYLCHGCGGCASSCPTGAISYAYPSVDDHATKMHALISKYLSTDGQQAKLLFYSTNNQNLISQLSAADARILPFEVEEIGYLGLDTFLYAFCLGVEEILICCIDEPAQTSSALKKQINLSNKILQSLKYQCKAPFIRLINNVSIIKKSGITALNQTIGLIDLSNKRNRIFTMVDFLYNNLQTPLTDLLCDFNTGDDSPFGEIIIDKSLCTLCMACTSVCPPRALSSGNLDKPIINFQENLCVQCSLCARSCPENAIILNNRLLFNTQQRDNKVILNQDKPFNCIECGKVFGSNQIIQKMKQQLKNHSMFADNKLANLEKCEDCRVKALFEQ